MVLIVEVFILYFLVYLVQATKIHRKY